MMPLLTQPDLVTRLSPRWRRVLTRQANRWMPPQAPDLADASANTLALYEAGVRVLAGTDAPNPGLVHGASLHRELQRLVMAGLPASAALRAATIEPAEVFGMPDRGRLTVGARADLVLVDGDPLIDVAATQRLRSVWIAGRPVDHDAYAGSGDERDGIAWLRESTSKIIAAIEQAWPGLPTPEDVRRDDGELLGRLVPSAGGWQPTTTFGAPLGEVTDHDQALQIVTTRGLACLTEPWWVSPVDETEWREAVLIEIRPGRIRLRWSDPMVEQSPSGAWYDLDDLELSQSAPPAVRVNG